MFEAIARFSVRYRWPIIVVWLLAVPLIVKTLPTLSSVMQSQNSKFLPADAPSIKALKLAAPFQGKKLVATSSLVAARADGRLTARDNAAITRAERAVARIPGVSLVRDQGISRDGKARDALVAISGAAAGGGSDAQKLVDAVRATFKKVGAPAGLALYLTGPLAESVDSYNSFNHMQSATQFYSVLLIVGLLLLVFRSLIVPLVTLIPVGCALLIAGPVIAQASKIGVEVSQITQVLLIVLILGAGTDYGLFLVFRVREEMRNGMAPREAVVHAAARSGESITFSAATVIAALLSLMLATFATYRGLGRGWRSGWRSC